MWINSNVINLVDDSVGFCLASAMMMIVFGQLLISCGYDLVDRFGRLLLDAIFCLIIAWISVIV